MDLTLFAKIVRPVAAHDFLGFLKQTEDAKTPFPSEDPLILHGRGSDAVEAFAKLAPRLAFGSAVVLADLDAVKDGGVEEIASANFFRSWFLGKDIPGLPENARTWVKAKWDGGSYGSHLTYLTEAVKRTTGPVLELGAGDHSTPALHRICDEQGRFLVTIDSNEEWLARLARTGSEKHFFAQMKDPATTRWLNTKTVKDPDTDRFTTTFSGETNFSERGASFTLENDRRWGVVFVDHAPGETRMKAVERAFGCADYVVVHDTDDLGYGLEPILGKFKYRKDFRVYRPWTTVVSMVKEIW